MTLQTSLAKVVGATPQEIQSAFDQSTNTTEFIQNLEYDCEENFRDLSPFQQKSLRLFYKAETL